MTKETNKRKTLRKYLLVGGVKGKYFRSDVEPTIDGMPYGGYRVENIRVTWKGKNSVDLSIRLIDAEDSPVGMEMYLSSHLDDPELTDEEVNQLKNNLDQRYAEWMSRSEKPTFPLR